MSEKTFVPNGPTFIGNITTLASQFSANIVANAPTSYVRINNFGDTSGSAFTSIWVSLTANTAPQVVGFATAGDPAWTGMNTGTLVGQSETVILAIDNTLGSKSSSVIQLTANADPTSSGTHCLFTAQAVLPI